MKKIILFLLFFSFSQEVLASSAKSVVETQVEAGDAQIYQSVETTVNGETIKKESNQPGKLELEMEKTGEGEPTVTFSQEEQSFFTPTPASKGMPERLWQDLTNPVVEFVKNLLSNLTAWFK